jgi:hypothetical protein
MGFLSFTIYTILENNQNIPQIFYSFYYDNFKEVVAGTEEDKEDKDQENIEQKICNKLFESDTCEQMKKDQPIEKEENEEKEKKELTEEQLKTEAIINKYLAPIESEKPSINNTVNNEKGLGNNIDNRDNSSIILSNQRESIDNVTSIQSSVNSSNILPNLNIDNLNQFQLADLISSTISNANNIDTIKVRQSLNGFIDLTKASGGNVIDYLKQIAEVISTDPSGNVAKRIINGAHQQ